MSSEEVQVKTEETRPSLLPSKEKVVQWLNLGCSSSGGVKRNHCGSPTRAPSGWSLSLSVSRAKRAREEEERGQAREDQGASASLKEGFATPELEEGEVPESPPPASLHSPGVNFEEECRLKTVVLEQQISALRKANDKLFNRLREAEDARLKEKEDAHLKISVLEKANAKLVNRLKEEEDAHLKECSALEKDVGKLQTKLKAADKADKAHVKEVEQLEKDKITLFLRLEKAKSETAQTARDWAAKVVLLKAKVENQKKNLAGLESKLHTQGSAYVEPRSSHHSRPYDRECFSGCGVCCQKVHSLEELTGRQRARMRNQADQLSNLLAVLAREKQDRQYRESADSSRLTFKEEAALEAKTRRSSLKTEAVASDTSQLDRIARRLPQDNPMNLVEKDLWQVATRTYPMATTIMKNYDELVQSLPDIRPAVRAAFAAMPPATRSLCLSQSKASQPSPAKQPSPVKLPSPVKQPSPVKPAIEVSATAAQPRGPAPPMRSPYRGVGVASGAQEAPVSATEDASGVGPAGPSSAECCTREQSESSMPPPERVFGPSLPEYGPSLPEYGPSLPQYGPSLPEYGPSLLEHAPSLPEHAPSLPEHAPSLPEHAPSLLEHAPSLPEYGPSLPEYGPSLPEYGPSPPVYGLSLPEYGPSPPPVGADVLQLESSASCEAPAALKTEVSEAAEVKTDVSETAAVKVEDLETASVKVEISEPAAQTEAESGSEPQMVPASEGPSTTAEPCSAEAETASMPPAVPLAVASPDAQRAPKSPPLPLASWAVPLTVSYAQYLYDGGKYRPPPEPVPTADTAADDQGRRLYGPRLPPPPAAVPPRLPLSPAAVPVDTASRKRPADQDAGVPASIPERNARIVSSIQGLKKRIVQHLQLKEKP